MQYIMHKNDWCIMTFCEQQDVWPQWWTPHAISTLCSAAETSCTGWCRINWTIYFCCPSSVFYNKTRKYDDVRVAPRTLVKAVLNVSSTGCNNEWQSFAKLSYSAIDNVLTNLLPAGLQHFFQVFNVSAANHVSRCAELIDMIFLFHVKFLMATYLSLVDLLDCK